MEKVSALLFVRIHKVEQEVVTIYGEEDGTERRESNVHTHYDTPSVPGMQVTVLGMSPSVPNEEQLWLVTTSQPVIVALSGEKDFEWLTTDMAQNYINDWGKKSRVSEIAESYEPRIIQPRG